MATMQVSGGGRRPVTYQFQDEAGSPAYMNAYDHRTVDVPFQNTVDDRLYLKADKAAAGSLTLWVVRASV